MNLEQKATKILSPLNSIQCISPNQVENHSVKERKGTSKTGRPSATGEEKKKTGTCSQVLEKMRKDQISPMFLQSSSSSTPPLSNLHLLHLYLHPFFHQYLLFLPTTLLASFILLDLNVSSNIFQIYIGFHWPLKMDYHSVR